MSHYSIHGSFYDSWLARHPRRSCEAFLDQTMEGDWDTKPTPIPKDLIFPDLWFWIQEIDRKRLES